MTSEIKLGKYRHYKGKMYEVIGIGIIEETLEERVIYRPLYEPAPEFKGKMWLRPVDAFLEKVEFNGRLVPRFEFISD